MRFARLSYQILATFVAVVILSLSVSGLLVTTLAQRIIEDNASRQHLDMANRIAQNVELQAQTALPIFDLLAEDLPTMWPVDVEERLQDVQSQFPFIVEIY